MLNKFSPRAWMLPGLRESYSYTFLEEKKYKILIKYLVLNQVCNIHTTVSLLYQRRYGKSIHQGEI